MRALAALALFAGCGDNIQPRVVPTIAIGYDAYRELDALPRVRIGTRAYLRSTYDRAGGNEAADASHFVRVEPDGTYTIVDAAGPGLLVFSRANHWHGSPWHVSIDGTRHAITESSTASPDMPVPDSVFMPAAALPPPLAVTWPLTHGADLDWVPKPFTTSLRISDERTHRATGYHIFHTFGSTDHLSAPIVAWAEQPPPADVLDLLSRAGTDIAPPGERNETTVDIPAQGEVSVFELAGPKRIVRLLVDAPASAALDLAQVRLAIRWDERELPSVEAPIGLLFAGGSLYNRDNRTQLVAGLLAHVTFVGDRVQLSLYYPMPFWQSARITLRGVGASIAGVRVLAMTTNNTAPAYAESYFHATYVDHGPTPALGSDLVLLDTTQVEGGGDWCGVFAGTSFTFSDQASYETLEGDPRFFFDDARTPQGHGTGTEEWAGGGDYWGHRTSSLALAGHPTGAPSLSDARHPADAIQSAYRFLVADAMPFGRNARITLEHGGTNQAFEHYRTVTYWYGRPSACLVQTDTFDVGDALAEREHDYDAPMANAITVESGWAGLANDVVESEDGRMHAGVSTFTVKIDPANEGVLLRRTLDYAIADQRAEVWVAGDEDAAFAYAGTWYVAGSTTSVYSNPPGELDAAQPIVQTTDRRLRDDELLIPRAFTRGRSRLRIQIRPSSAWTELRYTVYSYVL